MQAIIQVNGNKNAPKIVQCLTHPKQSVRNYVFVLVPDQNMEKIFDYSNRFSKSKPTLNETRSFPKNTQVNKSSTFFIGFRGISQLGSAFIFLR